jgi:hypothetical protein
MKLFEFSYKPVQSVYDPSCQTAGPYVGKKLSAFFRRASDDQLVAIRQVLATSNEVHISDVNSSDIEKLIEDFYLEKDWAFIKSKRSCRFIFMGYDMQIFLCLTHADELNFLSDDPSITIVECSDLLTTSDFFDGY